MSLETTLTDIIARLRQGRFPNEQAISQGIVLRVLQELGWDIYDTTSVWPEFQTGEGRADFALCHPPSKPADFIEVKPPGKAEDGVRQALEYAFHTGVPFIVLTDGKTWSFYLPAEQGSYEDRRVYKLDLFERPPIEAAETLRRYLARERIESGEALEAARKEYRSRNRRTQACAARPPFTSYLGGWLGKRRSEVYTGWLTPLEIKLDAKIVGNRAKPVLDFNFRWFNTFKAASQHPPRRHEDITGRLYRTWEHAELYHLNSLASLRKSLKEGG